LQRQALSLAGFQLTAPLFKLLALRAGSRALTVGWRLRRSQGLSRRLS
jgi:hypothetical protein